MSEQKKNIFSDRRSGTDRRRQNLPMPAELDRRKTQCRRTRSFSSKPWWLRIAYAVELVSEKPSDTKSNNSDSNVENPDEKLQSDQSD